MISEKSVGLQKCGNFEQPFWEFKHWKLGILMSVFYWEQYGFRVVVI
jgi:hypothetical protein